MWRPSKFLLFFCTLLIFGLIARSSAQLTYRLSKDVIPDLYDITIKPYLQSTDGAKQFTFDGEVNITLHAVVSDVFSITLHKDYLDIVEGILYHSNGSVFQNFTNDMTYTSVFDKLTIFLYPNLEVDTNYTLYMKYEGQIRSGMAGVFRGTYDDVNWYGITQLQRIDARTAFPCFDEPAFKAKFRMRISRPKDYRSFFNTRLISTTNDGTDRYLDEFEETPLMSTYLVAFLIGEFESHGDTDFQMIMHSKFNNKTNFSHEVALKTLDAYDKYTQLPYKTLGNTIMQKAGSTRFPHNGMENWGLVIYHDSVLAQEPNSTDGWSDKEYTITILVHETAHMWFGNSVTFKWWSYFWLNEGFARYYQYFLAHELYPEYELDKQFVVRQLQLIFGTDATTSSQPLTSAEHTIKSPAEIAYKFSSIAYAKGASIIRMIKNLMGSENFDSAIRDYLKENHLKNTIPDDLFKHFKNYWPAEQQVDIYQFLYDWTEQLGYPMLKVSTTSSGEYTLEQDRYILDESDSSVKYTIPITYTTAKASNFDDLTPKFYFNRTARQLTFGNSKEDEWIIFNIQQSNYYRVFYDATLLGKLHKAFLATNHSGIHVLNRANVVDDLFNYGRKGLLGYDKVFHFMEYLIDELEYIPWYSALNGINTVHQRMTVEQQKEFGTLLFELLDRVYGKLGFEKSNDTVLDVYHRNKVINWLCKYHHSDCNSQAQSLFLSHYENNTKPTPDFREHLYCAACRNDDQLNIYSKLKEMYARENLLVEQERIIRAMGCTLYNVTEQFEFILSNDVPQDLKTIGISNMYTQTMENVTPVFVLITENVHRLAEILGWSTTAAVISDIADYFTTEEQMHMLQKFNNANGLLFASSYFTLLNASFRVSSNLWWANTYLPKLFEYLDERYNRNSAVSFKAATMVIPLLVTLLLQFFM